MPVSSAASPTASRSACSCPEPAPPFPQAEPVSRTHPSRQSGDDLRDRCLIEGLQARAEFRYDLGGEVACQVPGFLQGQTVGEAIQQAGGVHIPEVPRTLNGKKLEVPIKRLLLGEPLEKVVNRDSMSNPGSLAWFVEFAAKRQSVSA